MIGGGKEEKKYKFILKGGGFLRGFGKIEDWGEVWGSGMRMKSVCLFAYPS